MLNRQYWPLHRVLRSCALDAARVSLDQFIVNGRHQDRSERPLLLIAGQNAETLPFSQAAYDAEKEPKELMIIPRASHFDLYDKPQHVKPAVERMAGFFTQHLK